MIYEGRVVRVVIFKALCGMFFLVLVLKFAVSKKEVPVMKHTRRLVPVLILYDLLAFGTRPEIYGCGTRCDITARGGTRADICGITGTGSKSRGTRPVIDAHFGTLPEVNVWKWYSP